MTEERYSSVGLAASQLEAMLRAAADAASGAVVAVAFPGRGAVLWHAGEMRFVGPVGQDFERAINALVEDVDVRSPRQVRDALLSMGGARLIVDRVDGRASAAYPH